MKKKYLPYIAKHSLRNHDSIYTSSVTGITINKHLGHYSRCFQMALICTQKLFKSNKFLPH